MAKLTDMDMTILFSSYLTNQNGTIRAALA
jgi:hypothetical protein